MPKITDINWGTKTEVPYTNCDRFICEEHAVESTYFETRLVGRNRSVRRDLYYCRACPDCTTVNQENWRGKGSAAAMDTNMMAIIAFVAVAGSGAWIILIPLVVFLPCLLPVGWHYYKRYQQGKAEEAERLEKLKQA